MWDAKSRSDPSKVTHVSSRSIKNSILNSIWEIGIRKEIDGIKEQSKLLTKMVSKKKK
jgi:hypothetical protein